MENLRLPTSAERAEVGHGRKLGDLRRRLTLPL
jgi:hypothetical protein